MGLCEVLYWFQIGSNIYIVSQTIRSEMSSCQDDEGIDDERQEVGGKGSNIDAECQRFSKEQSLDGHDNKLMYVTYGAALIKGTRLFYLPCPILVSAITIMYLKVKTVRNENVRFVSSRDGISEDSMVMESKIDGKFFLPQHPENHRTTTECFVKEKVAEAFMYDCMHFA